VTDGLDALLARCVPYALPLALPFRGLSVREGVLVEGPTGWGDFAPFADYSDPSASWWLDAAVEASFGQWPSPERATVEVNAIVPALPPADAARAAAASVARDGCRTVKVKVGDQDDVARVRAVRDAVDEIAPGCLLRLDANGSWSADEAVARIRMLQPLGLEYVEQPCRSVADLRRVRRAVDVPIAVDETVRQSPNPLEVRVADHADLAILKVGPLGGVGRALRIAEALDVPVVVSGALDSAVGLAAGVALAAALPGPVRACGLGTGALLAADVVREPWRPIDGRLDAGRVVPDAAALAAAAQALPPGHADAWRNRVAAAWRAGTAGRLGPLVRAAA
jgi:O-succinylbenzoate synthase